LAATVPTAPPSSFRAGDTVVFTQFFGDYPPSDGWELSVRLITDPPTGAVVTDDGVSTYTVSFTAEATEGVTASGAARLFARVSLPTGYVGSAGVAGESHTVLDQFVTILPNLGTATVASMATNAEAHLAAAHAQLATLLATPMESYSIGGRAAAYRALREVRAEIATWQHQVWLERNPTKAMPTIRLVFSGR
jgi:hypothetical protein